MLFFSATGWEHFFFLLFVFLFLSCSGSLFWCRKLMFAFLLVMHLFLLSENLLTLGHVTRSWKNSFNTCPVGTPPSLWLEITVHTFITSQCKHNLAIMKVSGFIKCNANFIWFCFKVVINDLYWYQWSLLAV